MFALPDHDTVERAVPVAQGDTPQVRVALPRHAGHVRVESTPPRARIFLNGQARGETPQVLRDVPTGIHSLRLEREGYDTAVRQVRIMRDAVADLRVTLGTAGTEAWKARRARALKLAVIPGVAQFSSPGQAWRGLVYVAGIGAAGYLAYDAHIEYNQAEKDHQAALEAYHRVVHQDAIDLHYQRAQEAIDHMDSARKRFTLTLAAAGGLYAVQWLDALIAGGGRIQTSVGQVAATMALGHVRVTWTF